MDALEEPDEDRLENAVSGTRGPGVACLVGLEFKAYMVRRGIS